MKQITIYTDGSSRGNPGPGGYGFICIYPNDADEMRIDERGGREDLTTNNRMELKAVIEALRFFDDYYAKNTPTTYEVRLDSAYVLNGSTKWLHGWKAKNWISSTKEEVKNIDLWQEMDSVLKGKEIKWTLLKGHSEIFGNERCDEIATAYADNKKIDLYSGFLAEYKGAEEVLNIKVGAPTKKSSKNKSPAYSYVSMVDGKINIDQTWDECKKRVHGKKALFKKSISKEDEGNIVKLYKVSS
jgi:ribonuclease HI